MAEQLVSGLGVQDDATAVKQVIQRVTGAKPKLVPIEVLRRAILLVLSTFTRQKTGAAATDNQVATFGQGSPDPNKEVNMGSPAERDLANLGMNIKANGCFTFDHLPTDQDTHLYLFGSAAFTHLASGSGDGELVMKLKDTQTNSAVKVFGVHAFGAVAADEDFTVGFGEQDIVVRGGREYCLEMSLTKSSRGQPVHIRVNGAGAGASNGVGFVRKQNLEGAYDWSREGGPVIPEDRISADIARANTIPTQLNADHIVVNTTNFDGNLARSDNDVQKVAQKLDDLVVAAGNAGLDQSQVDARVNARVSHLVLAWVLAATKAVIPNDQLPPKLVQLMERFRGFLWEDEGNVAADNAFIGPPRARKYTAAQIPGLPFAQTFEMSPANVNWWIPVRVPDGKVDETFRIYLDEGLFVPASEWEQTEKAGGYTYYQAQAANLPVAIFKMQRYEEAFLSGDEVDARIRAIVPAWARTANPPLEAPQTLAQFRAKKDAGTLTPGHWYPIT